METAPYYWCKHSLNSLKGPRHMNGRLSVRSAALTAHDHVSGCGHHAWSLADNAGTDSMHGAWPVMQCGLSHRAHTQDMPLALRGNFAAPLLSFACECAHARDVAASSAHLGAPRARRSCPRRRRRKTWEFPAGCVLCVGIPSTAVSVYSQL